MAIELKGADELRARVVAKKGTNPKLLDWAMDDTADAILLKAMRLVPVLKGILRGSMLVKAEYLKKRIVVQANYAASIEFGEPVGGNSPKEGRAVPPGPRPYLRPAFHTESKRVEEFYGNRLRNI